jgi:PadR family transcriptional regulator PadR
MIVTSVMEVHYLSADQFKALRRFVDKLTRENLWIYVLRLLQEGPKQDSEIRDTMNRRFGFEPTGVTSHTILYKMVRDGLVEVKKGNGKSDQRHYEITSDGERAMQSAKVILTNLIKNAFDLT